MKFVKKMWKNVKKWGPPGPPVKAWILAHFLGVEKRGQKVDFFCKILLKNDLRSPGPTYRWGSSVSANFEKKFLFLPGHFWGVHSRWKIDS